MRKQEISPTTIIETTISLVAKNGLETISTRKVANAIGISEGSIFNYFPNKKALLTSCLYYIDGEIDKALKGVGFQGFSLKKNAREMWYVYFKYLSEHGDYAKYYRQFRHSHYYDEETIKGQGKSFSFFTNFLFKHMSVIKVDPGVFWVYMIETTLNFAIRVADGDIPNKQENIDNFFNLIWNGVAGVWKKDKSMEIE